MSWQPMGTAPRDGTPIIVWMFGIGSMLYAVRYGVFDDDSPCWFEFDLTKENGFGEPALWGSDLDSGGFIWCELPEWRLLDAVGSAMTKGIAHRAEAERRRNKTGKGKGVG